MKYLLAIITLFIFVGCQNIEPKVNNNKEKNQKESEYKWPKFKNMIVRTTLYNQQLETGQKILKPNYIKKLENNNSPFEVRYFDKTSQDNFGVTMITDYKLDMFEVSFPKEYEYQSINIELTKEYKLDGESIKLVPREVWVCSSTKGTNCYKYTTYSDEKDKKVGLFYSQDGNIAQIKIFNQNMKRHKYYLLFNDFFGRFKNGKIIELTNKMIQDGRNFSLNSKDINIYINGYDKEKIVFKALKERNDTELNEELIREVSLKNNSLFRKIQVHNKEYNLIKYSIAKLPRDVDVRYALKNYSDILKKQHYKTTSGKYKNFIIKIEQNKNNENQIKVSKDENIKINKTDKRDNTKRKYIDLSQGI